jgi:hypothetical protein
MRKRNYLIGASLGVIGALVVASTAFGGVPTNQTTNVKVSPSKVKPNTPAGLQILTAATYTDFNASPPPKEALFKIGKGITLNNGSRPACSSATLQAATTTTAVNSACQKSVVGTGSAIVNGGTSPLFPGTNPVLLVKGPGSTLFIWVRIGGAQTLVLNGQYAKGPNTLDVTGLPNVAGVDLTQFNVNIPKAGQNSYVKATCKGSKWVTTETVTFYSGTVLIGKAQQKCKAL